MMRQFEASWVLLVLSFLMHCVQSQPRLTDEESEEMIAKRMGRVHMFKLISTGFKLSAIIKATDSTARAAATMRACAKPFCRVKSCERHRLGWHLHSRDWGCCTRHLQKPGCCLFASAACYTDDRMCQCCQYRYCGKHCKKHPSCKAKFSKIKAKINAGKANAGGKAKINGGNAMVKGGKPKVNPGKANVNEAKPKVNEGKGKVNEGKAEVNEGKAKVNEGKAKVNEGKAKVNKGKAKVNEGKAKVNEGKAKVDEGKATANEGMAEVNEGKAKVIKAKVNAGKPSN